MDRIISEIKKLALKQKGVLRFMEVCGTHTVSIFRYGIPSVLPENIKLISGPGCPVCVTDTDFIDKAIEYLRRGYKIFTFGDMLRVPGSKTSLEKEASQDIHIVYSPLDALFYALKNKNEKVLLLAVGFETTAPLIAATVLEAYNEKASNFFILSSLKLIPPALESLLKSGELNIDGLILPGHVAVIIGISSFKRIAEKYNMPSVISGFEAKDILETVFVLLGLIKNKELFNVQYKRAVNDGGNISAQEMLKCVFDIDCINWRGLGNIHSSGLKLKEKYKSYDIERKEPLKIKISKQDSTCRCSDVIKGLITPHECGFFAKKCSPQNPLGPCMVSSEGTCSAYYKYCREYGGAGN